jgi:hypothetical protein
MMISKLSLPLSTRLPLRVAATLLTVGLLALAVQPAQAQWKWRDASGRVTASDRPPPPGVAEKDIIQRPGAAPKSATTPVPSAAAAGAAGAATASATPASGAARKAEPELEARRKRADEEVAARKKAEDQAAAAAKKADDERIAAAKADNCQRARGALRAIEDGQRIARTKPNGEREFLDDAQRAAEAQKMRGVVASDCK